MYFVRQGFDIVTPNYYWHRFEADVLRIISGSNYTHEFEIKISRSDFFADFKKNNTHWKDGKFDKHSLIKSGTRCNRFSFVVPKGLISKEEVPDYAGLIYYNSLSFDVIKPAKLIHKNPFNDWKELAKKTASREFQLRMEERKKFHKSQKY